MRARTLLTALFGLSLAVAGFAFMNSVAKKSDANVPQQQILSASVELPAGTLLRAQDITWKPVVTVEADEIARPTTAQVEIKPDIVEDTAASVYGAVLRHALDARAPIHRGDIVKPGDRDFLQVVLSPGARAIAIPVSTGGASTGLLTPGDRVDVMLTQNFKNDQSTEETRNTPLTRRSVGETIVQNLRVLAIDASDGKANNANPNNGNFGRTVTLEVTPVQAETINVAAELGKLSVTLRSTTQVQPVGAEPPVKEQWAGDVSPALTKALPPKTVALKPLPVMILRGGIVRDKDRDYREQLVKPESETESEKKR